MSVVDDLQREIGDVRRQLDDLQRESRANADTLAVAIRKTRLQVDAGELQASVRRGRPSSAAKLWDPRGGEFSEPNLATSLISRLRSGDPVGNRMGDLTSDNLGLRNFFADAMLRGQTWDFPVLATGVSERVAYDWTAIKAASGMTYDATVFPVYFGVIVNPFRTYMMMVNMENWSGAGSGSVELSSTMSNPAFDPTLLPWAVFSVMVYKDPEQNQYFTDAEVAVTLHIRDPFTPFADFAVSVPVDYKALPSGEYTQLSVAVASSVWDTTSLNAIIKVALTTTGVGGTPDAYSVGIANPQWELSAYQSPSLFIPEPQPSSVYSHLPYSGSYEYGLQVGGFDDFNSLTNARVGVGLDPAGGGMVTFGTGGATNDLLLHRTGTKTLTLDDGTAAPASAVLDIEGQTRIRGIISPAQIVANTDNYNPTDLHLNGILRINSDAARNLTGINAGASGEIILLVNTGGFTITLIHDLTSTAANRFLCPGSVNYALTTNSSVILWYDLSSSRWRVK